MTRPLLVLLVGPAASGKSAVSRALVDELRADGEAVALVEVDAIAGMAFPTLPDWSTAHEIFASVIAEWLDFPLSVVVAEGVSSRDEVDIVLGVTRDPEYLRGVYAGWSSAVPTLGAELTLDTDEFSIAESVASVRRRIRTEPS